MTLLDDVQADLDVFFDLESGFAGAIDYTPSGGVKIFGIPALIRKNAALDHIQDSESGYFGIPVARNYRANFQGGGKRAIAVIWVRKNDVPNPGYGDVVTFDGEDWQVLPVVPEV